MKNLICTVLFLSLLFCGCKKEETNYTELLSGTWVNTQINGEKIPSDSSFVSEYRPKGVQMYAQGYQLDENNKSWIENDSFTYTVEGEKIMIDGTDAMNKNYHIEMDIKTLDEESFTYSVTSFSMDHTEYPDTAVYTCLKATEDYTSSFTGIWYGSSTSPGAAGDQYYYWEYKTDGSFNFYYQDNEGNWLVDADEESHYFLYGDFLATNYTAARVADGNNMFYDCWNIHIDGNTMTLTALRENNQIESYEMEKVESLPAM